MTGESEFIAAWFPFTIDEIRTAFLAVGLPDTEATDAARALAADVASSNEEDGYLFAEFGDFLGPIATLSMDAAHRVAEFRRTWGPS